MTRGERVTARFFAAALVGVAFLVGSSVSRADNDSPARKLFKEGRALAAAGDYAAACPKFQASLELEPGVGTQFNLADCWEHIGRTASAQKLFLGAAASAKAAGESEREQVLRERAGALEPRLSKLVIDVSDVSPRLTIKRDGLPLEEEQWGKAIAVDAGSYELVAKAPGKKPWRTTVEVKAGTPVVTVEVPVLEPLAPLEAERPVSRAPAAPRKARLPAPSPAARDRGPGGPNYRAFTFAGVGIAGATVATIMGLKYRSNNDAAKDVCPSSHNCSQDEIDDHDALVKSARTDRVWMFAAGGVGAVGLAGAAFFLLFDRPERAAMARWHAVPTAGRDGLGASLLGSF